MYDQFSYCSINSNANLDNWALLYAQRLALKLKLPLHVCFCLVPKFLGATYRHFGFMLKGIKIIMVVQQ